MVCSLRKRAAKDSAHADWHRLARIHQNDAFNMHLIILVISHHTWSITALLGTSSKLRYSEFVCPSGWSLGRGQATSGKRYERRSRDDGFRISKVPILRFFFSDLQELHWTHHPPEKCWFSVFWVVFCPGTIQVPKDLLTLSASTSRCNMPSMPHVMHSFDV